MLTYNTLVIHELNKIILEEIDRLKDELAFGASAPDYAHYREKVGQIQGLRKAIEFCDEALSRVEKR